MEQTSEEQKVKLSAYEQVFLHINSCFCCNLQKQRANAIMKHGGRRRWLDLRKDIYVYVTYLWHSEQMSTINEEMQNTVWKSMIGVDHSGILGCDANMEPEEQSQSIWFQMLEAVVVATEDEASTYRANVATGFVTCICFCFLARGDLVDVVNMPTIIDERKKVEAKPRKTYMSEKEDEDKSVTIAVVHYAKIGKLRN